MLEQALASLLVALEPRLVGLVHKRDVLAVRRGYRPLIARSDDFRFIPQCIDLIVNENVWQDLSEARESRQPPTDESIHLPDALLDIRGHPACAQVWLVLIG